MIVRVDTLDNNIIKLIKSDDYRDRLEGEYLELLDRHNKLANIISKYDRGVLDFTPTTPIYILKAQLYSMRTYLNILDYRINLECTDNCSSD